MKPILKYRGGKSKEIPSFIKYIPKYETYFEPFFGGGATYFHLEPQKAFISDVNEQLISFYKEISGSKFFEIKKELEKIQIEYESNRKIFMERKLKTPDKHVEDPNDFLYLSLIHI